MKKCEIAYDAGGAYTECGESLEPANQLLPDFPKLHCPFMRYDFEVDRQDWKKHGRRFQLRKPKAYLAVNEINPGYEWVFEDPDTFAVEKLDGSNVKLVTDKGRLTHVQNRLNLIDPLQVMKGKTFIIEGIFMSIQKGYIQESGIQCGELVGPKLQGNPYKLPYHLFYPFTKAVMDLRYKSFDSHARTYDNWSSWFKDYLISLYHNKLTKLGENKEKVFAEGVIFYNLKRKEEGKTYMAKLRRNMFKWFYEPDIKIGGRI